MYMYMWLKLGVDNSYSLLRVQYVYMFVCLGYGWVGYMYPTFFLSLF